MYKILIADDEVMEREVLTDLVARRVDPFKTYTIAQLTSMYDLLTPLKSEELQNQFYADGAAMEHALDEGAMKTYSASNIKKNV